MNKAEKLFDAITDVRDDLIDAAQTYRFRRRAPLWKRYGSLAACLILLLGAMTFFRFFGGMGGSNSAKNDAAFDGATSDNAASESSPMDGGSASDDAMCDDAGDSDRGDAAGSDEKKEKWHEDSILPLTIEGGDNLAVERALSLTRGEKLLVEDRYSITSAEAQQITLLYPVAARPSTFDGVSLTANGEELVQEIMRVDVGLDQLDPSNAMSHVEPGEVTGDGCWIFWTRAKLSLSAGETVEICISYEKPMPESGEIAMDEIPPKIITVDGEMAAVSGEGNLRVALD